MKRGERSIEVRAVRMQTINHGLFVVVVTPIDTCKQDSLWCKGSNRAGYACANNRVYTVSRNVLFDELQISTFPT